MSMAPRRLVHCDRLVASSHRPVPRTILESSICKRLSLHREILRVFADVPTRFVCASLSHFAASFSRRPFYRRLPLFTTLSRIFNSMPDFTSLVADYVGGLHLSGAIDRSQCQCDVSSRFHGYDSSFDSWN